MIFGQYFPNPALFGTDAAARGAAGFGFPGAIAGGLAAGSSSVNVAPRPRPGLAAVTRPPWSSAIALVIARPNPSPPNWRVSIHTLSAGAI